MTTADRRELGRRGEALAEAFLKKKGYAIVGRNVRYHQLGELDLVALDGRVLVFVEVKTRRSLSRDPAEAVNFAKQRRVALAAEIFLQNDRWRNHHGRFDVVEVYCPPGGVPTLNHIVDAFEHHRN